MAAARHKRYAAALMLVPLALFETGASGASTTASSNKASAANSTAASSDVDDATLVQLQSNQTLELAVFVNGSATGKIGEFVVRNGVLFTSSNELSRLGLLIPRRGDADGLVALSRLRGFAIRIDQPNQTLYVTASPEFIAPSLLGQGPSPGDYRVESGTGAVLNYDVVGTILDGRQLGSGLFDARLFSPLGVLSSGLLVETPFGAAHDEVKSGIVRLDTAYVYSDPRTLRRYRVGDFINGGLPWTRPVRLGGVQVNSDFSMRPDLITFPVPEIGGSAAVPSTVDVLVNGSRVLSGSVPAGPFEVPQVPVITGGGTVTTTVTDALGRQVVTELPFYASSALLAPKLQTYSAEFGFVRRNWGVLSNDYGPFAGSVTYRRGLSSYVTIEAHAEGTKKLGMAGIGADVNVGNLALVNVAVAGSSFLGKPGGQVSVGVERITPFYSLGGSVIKASRNFGDVAAASGDPVTMLQLNIFGSVALSRFGSLGVAYTEVKREGRAPNFDFGAAEAPILPVEPEHSRILTASYSKQFGRMAFYASAFRDLGEQKRTSILVGLTIPLGRRMSATASAQVGSGERSGQVEASQNATIPGEWGFRVFAAGNGTASSKGILPDEVSDHEFGEVTYNAQWAQLLGGVDRNGGRTTIRAEIRGAFAAADGGVFASEHIDDSFAVVDTEGMGGIRVRDENRDVGRTDSRGRLLVPDLRSFEVNHISIEPLDAPIAADVETVSKTVRPQDRSGVIMKFPVKISHGALLRLVDGRGEPIPVGSTATLRSTRAAVPVGYEGEAYVVDLNDRNDLDVDLPDGNRCVVHFDYKSEGHDIPTLGPVICRELAQ